MIRILILMALLPSISFADQCEYMSVKQADQAYEILKSSKAYEYCETCGDESPKELKGFKKKEKFYEDMKSIGVDAAYVYVEKNKKLINLASLVGCKTINVKKEIKLQKSVKVKKNNDLIGSYKNKNLEGAYSLKITYKNGSHYLDASGVNGDKTIEVDNAKLIKVSKSEHRTKKCPLKVSIVSKGKIIIEEIKREVCGGMGMSLNGEWVK